MKIVHEQEQRNWKLTQFDTDLVEAIRAIGWRHLYRTFDNLDQGLQWCLRPDCLFLAEWEVSEAEQKAAMRRSQEANRKLKDQVDNLYKNPLGWFFGLNWPKKDDNQ